VRVHRGAQASQVAAQLQADAVTIGEEVFLSAGNDDEGDPSTRALLAHELTHVARRRHPRFVPPLVDDLPTDGDDEETLARTVESRARRVAQIPVEPVSTPQLDTLPLPTPGEPLPTGIGPVEAAGQDAGNWGGLPAPWEPLPAWLGGSWSAPPANPTVDAPAAPAASAVPAMPAGGVAPVVARAAIDRSVEGQTPLPAAPAQRGVQQETPPQDIDALAKQVYEALKQRLSAERRRLG
jgi:hypothetical protein